MAYFLACLPFVTLAVKTLFFDLRDHKKDPAKRRGDLFFLIIGALGLSGTLWKTAVDSRAAEQKDQQAKIEHAADQGNIKSLHGQIGDLSQSLDEIKASVVSAPLLNKIDELQGQIARVQALANRSAPPAPKAKLEATYFTTALPFKAITKTEATAFEGVISVPVAVHNTSANLASNVSIWVTTCGACEVIDLPPSFSRRPGEPLFKASVFYQRIEPGSSTDKVDFRVKVPRGLLNLDIAVETYCDTCGPKKADWLHTKIYW